MIERILRHCGLWNSRPPPETDASVHDGERDDDLSEEIRELTYVDEDTFWATF